jgi:SAM-dependent methyltransferase
MDNVARPEYGKSSWTLYSHCPICRSSDIANKWSVKGFTIAHCDGCDLLFVRDQLTQEELGPYYEIADTEFVYNDPVNEENLKFYFKNAKKLIDEHISHGRILDVGCSTALFLDVMGGWERHGIEFPSQASDVARSKYGDSIHLGTLETYECAPGYFDCITFFDSFDHMLNPVDILDRVSKMLRPGGLLVIKVHDTGCLYAKISGKSLYSIVPPYHVFFYTRPSLENALVRAGFRIGDFRHMAHILQLKTIPFRLSRGDQNSIFYSLYKMLEKTPMGGIRIRKNLHDLMTVLAIKEA